MFFYDLLYKSSLYSPVQKKPEVDIMMPSSVFEPQVTATMSQKQP